MQRASFHGAITAMISWAEDVISVAEPPIMSDGSESGGVFGSVLVLLDYPSNTSDGLKNLSRNMLDGTGSRLELMRARKSAA